MPAPVIAALPTAPNRREPANFPERSDAFFAALALFRTQLNEFGAWMGEPVSESNLTAVYTEMRDGRVGIIDGAEDPSGRVTSPYADFLITVHNGSGRTRTWRPTAAPGDGLETANLKKDATVPTNRWWVKTTDADVTQAITDLTALISAETVARTAALSLEAQTRADADANANEFGWPGDAGYVFISDAGNRPLLAYDDLGRLLGDTLTTVSGWPGDWVVPKHKDSRGVIIEGFDSRDGSPYMKVEDVSGWPGDWIIGLDFDLNRRIIRGIDQRDQSLYPLGTDSGGGGGSVEFVDPGFSGEVYGAVADADGTIKFTTKIAPVGELLGMEKRNGLFFADTGQVALAILAIGGGDIGGEADVKTYPWHIFDEDMEPTPDGTEASGFAASYLRALELRWLRRYMIMPIAEVIGSTTAADVADGSARRIALMNRLNDAIDSYEEIGKTAMVPYILMDLLDGAPTTAQATADTHYAATGNSIRLETVAATGQAVPPRIFVNQGFGTRTDGTSPVILAEGRLDWNHFSLGFVVPTPLYPFDLAVGSPINLSAQSLLLVRELMGLAAIELDAGREWFCPSLEEAIRTGLVIAARFTTLTGALAFVDAVNNHGFTLVGAYNGAKVASVAISGTYVNVTLDRDPVGAFALNTGDAFYNSVTQNTIGANAVNATGNSAGGPDGTRKFVSWPINFPEGTIIGFDITVTGSGSVYGRFDDNRDLNAPNIIDIMGAGGVTAGTYHFDYTVGAVSALRKFLGFVLTQNSTIDVTNFTVTFPSTPTLQLAYAYGKMGTPGDNKPINRGSLNDGWTFASDAVGGQTQRRFARSGRVNVT